MNERRRWLAAARDEAGVFLVLYALMMVTLFVMAAIVIDLGAVRNERRKSRNAADAAALAGAQELAASPRKACQTAWNFAARNLGFTPPAAPCGSFPLVGCPPPGPDAQGTVGNFVISIRNPVPSSDDMMKADTPGGDVTQTTNPAIDGQDCDRIGVQIMSTQQAIFSKIVGIQSNSTTVHSVGLAGQGTFGEPVALLILDTTGCDALKTSGQGSVTVEDTVTSTGEQKPGIIAMESDGSQSGNPIPGCANSNNYTIDASNNSNNFIVAEPTPSGDPGKILSFALSGTSASKSYDPSDVSSVPARLSPVPTSTSKRITRAPVDHRYNCKVSNGCTTAPNPYIDQLVTSLGGSGATPPTGYRVFPDELVTPPPLSGEVAQPAAACSMNSTAPAVAVPTGNWFVNCNGGLSVSNVLTFSGGNVVTRSEVSVGAQGILTFNAAGGTSTTNGVLFIRDGDLIKDAQGVLTMKRVTVYQANGRINIGAGNGALTWIAPDTGNFDDLGLWSELVSTNSATEQRLGGQSGLDVQGVLFMPNAQFVFNGQTGVNQTNAQFITKRLLVQGQGALKMKPDPERVVLLPLSGIRLIR